MKRIRISGWQPGFKKIGMNKLLRTTGMSLSTAKDTVDTILAGSPVDLEFSTESAARDFLAEAQNLGAVTDETGLAPFDPES